MLGGWGVEAGRGVIAMEVRPVPGIGVSVGCECCTWVSGSGASMPGGVMAVESGDVGREVKGVESSDDILLSRCRLSYGVFIG